MSKKNAVHMCVQQDIIQLLKNLNYKSCYQIDSTRSTGHFILNEKSQSQKCENPVLFLSVHPNFKTGVLHIQLRTQCKPRNAFSEEYVNGVGE